MHDKRRDVDTPKVEKKIQLIMEVFINYNGMNCCRFLSGEKEDDREYRECTKLKGSKHQVSGKMKDVFIEMDEAPAGHCISTSVLWALCLHGHCKPCGNQFWERMLILFVPPTFQFKRVYLRTFSR